jgi:acyl-coenzyme A synthetase/AMP-(fatty) acid ligase/surfactin synthase thioesterase subunit
MNLLDRLVGTHVDRGAGDRIAYVDAEVGEVTYAQLTGAVRRYSAMLAEHGVKPGTNGLVVADDAVATVVAVLGLWANQCVPVPVSPLLADSELTFIASDCGAGFVHLDRPARGDLFPGIPQWRGLVPSSDGFGEQEPAAAATDRAVLIQYTSGSTGVPKGVLHGLAGIEAVLDGFGRTLALTPDDTVLSTAKLSFGYGFGNSLLFPLAAGARAVLLSGPVDPHRLSATVGDHRPTVLFSVPRMYHGLVELAARGGTPDLGSVRLAVSAGEHLPADLHQRFEDTFGVPLVNGLGATEVLHIVVATRPNRTEKGATGRPVPGVVASVRDPEGGEVYNGAEGRLHIAGPTVALGYLDRPEQTAKTFADGGAYTGDVVRHEAGLVWYVCRGDDLLNLGGYRVSPLEIEAVARQTEGVADCAVVGHTDPAGLQEAVTYLVPAPGADRDRLRRAVTRSFRDHLAPFKRPSRVEVLDALPTTSTGKLARFKLRTADPARVTRRVLTPRGDRALAFVPYAGGTAQAYSRLIRSLSPVWTVVSGEAAYQAGVTLADAAEAWWSAVGDQLAPGSVLFGHSAGAAVVGEIAQRYGDRLAGVHVVVSAPPLRLPDRLLAAVADGDEDLVLDSLAATGLLPGRDLSRDLSRDELRRLVLPGFVADLQPLRYGWKPEVPTVPVHVLVGSDDPTCRPRDVDDVLGCWPLAGLHLVEGGHYFCVDNPAGTARLLEEIARS